MSTLLLVAAAFLFLLAALTNGVFGADPHDLAYVGLALFALAHLPLGDWIGART